MSLQVDVQELQKNADSINRSVESGQRFQESYETELPNKMQEIDDLYASLDEESKLKLKQLFEQLNQGSRLPDDNSPEAVELKQRINDYIDYLGSYAESDVEETYSQGRSR